MKPEKLVEACSTLLEFRELVWACAAELGPLAVVNIAHDCALETLPKEKLAEFAVAIRNLAEGIEKLNFDGDPE